MRIFKPTTAVITAVVLALAPASAYAIHGAGRHAGHRTASPSGGCKLSVNAAPRYIEDGESALVFGRLSCAEGSVANQTVTVMERSPVSTPAASAGTATTDAAGNYQLTTAALSANTAFYATALGARSGEKTVRVAPKISLTGPENGSELFTGAGPLVHNGARPAYRSRVVFSGTVSPTDAGATVVLQRENANSGSAWYRIGPLATVRSNGSFSIVHTFTLPGAANIRVLVRANRSSYRSASEPLSYEISQPQNGALTIFSSAEPVSYGQSTTITGTLAAGAGKTVTLLERARSGRAFVAVANAVTTTGGAYTFASQTPLQSVFYKVTGAGQSSTALFEGVTYTVSNTAVGPTTVKASQPLTFTGTVTPARPGHVVYLQVQNPLGLGFHVADVGIESASGSFSITHSPFVAGPKKFRIKVPGDPEFEGAASPLLTVEVTPAPAGALTPELPSNSSLPSEGQI
jgi:hypothetical protein